MDRGLEWRFTQRWDLNDSQAYTKMLISLVIQEMQIKTLMSYHYGKKKKVSIITGKAFTPMHCKVVQLACKTV